MASNNRVNDFANAIRRNVDKDSTGIRVYAMDTVRKGFLGKIVIRAGKFKVKAYIDSGDNFSIRAVGRKEVKKYRRCLELERALERMGYTTERDGFYVVSNIAFTRASVSKLAVALAA